MLDLCFPVFLLASVSEKTQVRLQLCDFPQLVYRKALLFAVLFRRIKTKLRFNLGFYNWLINKNIKNKLAVINTHMYGMQTMA